MLPPYCRPWVAFGPPFKVFGGEKRRKLVAEREARRQAEDAAIRLAEENALFRSSEQLHKSSSQLYSPEESGKQAHGFDEFRQERHESPQVDATAGRIDAAQEVLGTKHGVSDKNSSAYAKWCKMHGKPVDGSRVGIFQENFLQVAQYFAPKQLT